jgi:hypothetical protein
MVGDLFSRWVFSFGATRVLVNVSRTKVQRRTFSDMRNICPVTVAGRHCGGASVGGRQLAGRQLAGRQLAGRRRKTNTVVAGVSARLRMRCDERIIAIERANTSPTHRNNDG